ncbi:MAG: porin [Xanthobacteraceae bacterium]|jgi:hypothetical protein|nr:porin [Xanthobacteraceae bacterium]
MRLPVIGLLVTTGGLAAVPALAAEPPAITAAYVKACKAQGPGFVYVVGTDTCLRIGSYLWAETYYNTYTDYPPQNATLYWVATLGLQLDARTATDYGTLRSYMELRMIHRTANPWSEAAEEGQFQPWDMHIEFAGFTFGFTQSFFDFYANQYVLGTDPATIGDQTQLALVGYTWHLPNGFSAQVSLEDSTARDEGLLPADPSLADPDGLSSDARLPEIVANFGQSGDWGQFLLSGALHQISASPNGSFIADTTRDWGYALQAGVMFNLPAIAAGDTLYLQAAYAEGAVSYLGIIDASGDFSPTDAVLRTDGSLAKTRGWSVVGQYLHNWNDTWNSAVFGGYATFDIADPVAQAAYGASGVANVNVGANLTWTPAPPLAITLQYDYNLYQAENFRLTADGLPVQSQDAHQVLLLFAATF